MQKKREMPKACNLKHTQLITLSFALVYRDTVVRYRRSILGPVWAIAQPLMLMVVFTFLSGILKIPSDGVPYVLFSYSALVPWAFFAASVNSCGPSIINNAGVLKKIAVPRQIFPIAAVLTCCIDFFISSAILGLMMAYYGVPFGQQLAWLPVLFALVLLLGLALGMFVAALGTYKHDIIFATGFLLQLFMYATPIIYPLSSITDRWRPLYVLNPMVGILEGFRSVIARGQQPDLLLLALSVPGVMLALVIAWWLFNKMAQYFTDVL